MKYNGKEVEIADNTPLGSFLKEKGYEYPKIAVEINLEIIPKADYDKVLLKNTDCLEVVCFMGGGGK